MENEVLKCKCCNRYDRIDHEFTHEIWGEDVCSTCHNKVFAIFYAHMEEQLPHLVDEYLNKDGSRL
jgi:hypothetical protein